MDKDKVIKIILTVVSLLILVGSFIGIYYMYENTYGKKDDKPTITITVTKGTE